MNSLKNLWKDRRLKSLLFIWILITFTVLIVFRDFIFGNSFAVFKDVGSDTIQQYVMQYSTIINHIRDKNFTLWDFNNGFGMNMLGLNLFNPFLMIIYALGTVLGPARIPSLIIYLIILEIYLTGTVIYFYLDNFSAAEPLKCIASYLYAFNGFMLLWGQHYQFGAYVVFTPLLLLLIERMLKKKKFPFPICILTAVLVMCSVYMSYMTLLFAGLYLIIRCAMLEQGKPFERIKLFIKGCISFVLGIGMGMAVFLPGVYYLLNISSRLNSGTSFSERMADLIVHPYPLKYYITFVYRMFSANYQGVSKEYLGFGNYYEAPLFFFTLLGVILVFQYVFTIHRQETSRRNKSLQYVGLALIAFFFLTQIGSCVFNAFAYPFSRHVFVLMPLLALLCVRMLEQILIQKKLSYAGLLFAFLLSAGVHFRAWQINYDVTLKNCILAMGITGAVITVLLFMGARAKEKYRGLILALLLLCTAGNICVEGYSVYDDRETLKKDDLEYFTLLYGNDINQALTYLRENDTSFYRTEKDYEAGSYCMDALAQNYYGISSYNGTQNKNILTFAEKLWPNLTRIHKTQQSFRQVSHDIEIASLCGIKYILSYNENLKDRGLDLEGQFGDLYLYRNTNVDTIGRFYTKTVSEDTFESYRENADVGNILADTLILPEITEESALTDSSYQLTEIPYPMEDMSLESVTDIPLDYSRFQEYPQIYMEFDITSKVATVYYFTADHTANYYIEMAVGETRHVRLTLPPDTQILRTGSYDPFQAEIKNIRFYGSSPAPALSAENKVQIEEPEKDSLIIGQVEAAENGYLFLPIPYENGWKAYVDNQETEILQADYGFSAVPVKSGEHSIRFEYHTPWLYAGCILAAISWLIFFSCLFVSRRGRQ